MAEPSSVLLAVDLGSARVGVAACDAGRVLAYPVTVLPAGEDLPDRVAALVDELGAGELVVGYPLALDGTAGIAAAHVVTQAEALAARVGVPVTLVDERMSTAEAHRKLRAAGRTAKTARRVVDAQAAVGILESVLCALAAGRTVGQRVEAKHG
ncbi:MAG: Holliday junction resolvase RuvX [Propionibacteriaceae bacterium]|nr:Holliday junction resolvase RuvX [Propionibacteriaceae bacterium]